MQCRRCKKTNKKVNCIKFSGLKDSNFVFVNESPKLSKKIKHKFDILLKLTKLKRSDIATMSAIRCGLPKDSSPTKKDFDACFIFNQEDIKTIAPKLVIVMGASACYSIIGKKHHDYIGKLIFSKKINKNVFITYGLNEAVQDSTKWEKMVDHFKKIPSFTEVNPFEPKHYEYIYIENEEEFNSNIELLKHSDHLYLDTETTGLNPWKERITLLQLGTEDKIILIDRRIALKKATYIKKLIESKGIIGAGFEFDHKFLYTNLNTNILNYKWDVILAEYILTGMKDNDLSFLTKKYVPESAGYDDAVKEKGGAHKVKDPKELRQYASDDVGVMLKIKRNQFKELAKSKRLWLYENLTLPTNKILAEMSIKGVLYDIEKVKEVDEAYKIKAEKLLFRAQNLNAVKACEKHFKRKFNPRSSQMIVWILIDYYKLPVIAETDTNNPSVGATEMKKYAEEYNNPYCILMEKYRSYQHIRNSFLSGVLPKLIDSVAHTTYSGHATTSGRPNSKNPNLLNLPAKEKDIKKCIKARKGCKFIHADESQLEVRCASVIFNDQSLIDIINSGKDFHSMITSRVHNVPYETVYDIKEGDVRPEWNDRRRICKAITFGILYQEGPKKLGYSLGITQEEAQEFINQYFKGFPDLRKSIDVIIEFVIEHGYIDNYFGFRRTWEYHTEKDHSTQREAVNFPIQSLAWNLLQLAMIQIDKALKEGNYKAQLVMQVYDSVIVETPDEEIPEVAKIVKTIMESVNKPFENINRVALKSDVEVGENLADLKKYEVK